ncbi:neutral zinc metallopeptidase [Streptomyces sp. NPDC057686]|uniref:neutral zinc metallopeptidase n=1 Tax=Streptomyces sp. NPDC057686 TaxID=3346212 RepID=UPI0036C862B5
MRRLVRLLFSIAFLVCASLSGTALGAPLASRGAASQPGLPAVIGADLAAETRDAIEVTDGFWVKHWPDFFTKTYQPPKIYGPLGFYDVDAGDFRRCNGEDPDKYNAYYCPDGDYLAWSAQIMDLGFNMIGDSWVYLVISHEWGHAIQARLNSNLQAIEKELQADCLAGATLQGATDDGTLVWEQGDTEEIVSALQKFGDTTPWSNPADHGDASQRMGFFTQGLRDGVNACLPG